MRPTSRRTPRLLLAGDDDATMTTPGVVRGLHPETCVPSAKISFFTSRMILGKLHTAVRSRTARSFPRVGASCSRVHSWAVVRSHVQRREHGHDTRVRRAVHGAVRSTGIVLPHRDELPARARPRVQPVRVSSTRSSPERPDDARRGDPSIDDEHTPPHPCARSRVNETTGRTNERATDGTSTSRASTR